MFILQVLGIRRQIKEITKTGASSSDKFYVWGLDLSQSLQGAGGIGGLVCAVHAGEVRHFFYDGNGNVGQVVNSDGSIAAHYEYDPFGNIVNGVPQSDDNPFRFSTKYYDEETGLYYYGFRDYSAELGRWWSRDPLGEEGGVNRYHFCFNNMNNKYDINGLMTYSQIKEVWDKYATASRILSLTGGLAQGYGGILFLNAAAGSMFVAPPLALAFGTVGVILVAQGANNIWAGINENEVNIGRSKMELAATKLGYSAEKGTIAYYGLEILRACNEIT